MKKLQHTSKMSIAIVLLLTAFAAGARSDIGVSSQGFGPGGGDTVKIRGNVVCKNCSLEEMRDANPREYPFYYQFTHKRGRLVMHVNWTSNDARWTRVAWPPRLWVRGEEEVIQQLGAEANLFKDVEITALLSNTRTLDIIHVTRADLGVR
jgi:hypothetical protein